MADTQLGALRSHPAWQRAGTALALALKLLPIVSVFAALAPFQWIANRLGSGLSGHIPLVFHRLALWTLNVRVSAEGRPLDREGAALLVGNHVSWLDIVVLGSITPLRFVSKDDVAGWPVFGTLARLQRTVFVDRTRRHTTGGAHSAIKAALEAGDRLVLFPEGTSSDGGQVLPFKSALIGAAIGGEAPVAVQPFALAYLRRDGLTITRSDRASLGWFGDMDLLPSLMERLTGGPLDVAVVGLPPHMPSREIGRKQLAKALEADVRRTLAQRLRSA